MSLTVVIFGGGGDLATGRLIPALAVSKVFADAEVVAVGRSSLSDEDYSQKLKCPSDISKEQWTSFLGRVRYIQASYESPNGYASLKDQLSLGDLFLYVAVPPVAVTKVLGAIVSAGLHQPHDGEAKIVLEKPFGIDALSAAELQSQLERDFPADAIYSIDHYLAKDTVSNMLAFRFGNALFEPLWSAEYIREVQVTVAETVGVENRLSSYVGLGASRDLLQNHVMQLLALLAMEEPTDWSAEALSHAKSEVLHHTYARADLTVLGQYAMDEASAEKMQGTDTYAASVLHIDTERWRGVPFAVRTGKKLAAGVTDVTVHFRPCASALFGTDGHANGLTFRIQPDESIFLSLAVKQPQNNDELAIARMTFCYRDTFKNQIPDAYVRVLEAICRGDRTVAVAPSVIQESWRIIEQMGLKDQTIHPYEPGSWGPEAADELLERQRSQWTVTDGDVCNGITLMES